MGVFSHDPFDRSVLLVCDDCDRVFQRDDELSDKARRDSTPDELAPHFRFREELAAPAIRAGWQATMSGGHVNAVWVCPRCAKGESGRRQ